MKFRSKDQWEAYFLQHANQNMSEPSIHQWMEKRLKDLHAILKSMPPQLKDEISKVNTSIPHEKIPQLKDNSIISIIENNGDVPYAYKHSPNPGNKTFLTCAWLDINNMLCD